MRLLALWVALLCVVLGVYWPGLHGDFIFDDIPNIVDNPALRINELTFKTILSSMSGVESGPLGRPVAVLSFAITHIHFGLDPFVFKITNLAIHGANGLLIFWLTTLLVSKFENQRTSAFSRWFPVWVSAVWLLHPINTGPILLVVQRMTLLSGMFVLLALIGHVKSIMATAKFVRIGWLVASWLIFWPLAIFSKETGVLFPLFATLVSLLVSSSLAPRAPSSQWSLHNANTLDQRQRGHVILSAILLLAALMMILSQVGWGWVENGYASRPFDMTERIMTEGRVLWFYVSQVIIPVNTQFGFFLDDFSISRSLSEPATTIPAMLGWVIVVLALPFAWRHWPVFAFGVAWFITGHTLESTILPLEIAHEHRNYIPSFGLIVAVGHLGASWLTRTKLDHRILTTSLVAILPIIILTTYTWLRSNQWEDPIRGTQLEAMHHPESSRANYTAAQVMFRAGLGDESDPVGAQMIRYHLEKAAASSAVDKLSHLALIYWACASNRSVEPEWKLDLTFRLAQTPFSPVDRGLPQNILKHMLSQPGCVERQEAIALFVAGSQNRHITASLRAKFLEAAADYELLVFKDISTATGFMTRAATMSPDDPGLGRKLLNYKEIDERLGLPKY